MAVAKQWTYDSVITGPLSWTDGGLVTEDVDVVDGLDDTSLVTR